MPSLLALLILLSGYRYLALDAANLDLYFDEAYYWGWSKNLAFGYYSKPPMIAWIIRAATSLCGDGELCIHTPPLLLYGLTALVIHTIGSRLYRPATGFVAALTFISLPLVSFYSWLTTTDALLLFFWATGLYGFLRAIDSNGWPDWLLTGTALGLGLLSKYTAALFLVSALLSLLWIPAYRKHLRNPKAGAALLLALLVFSPNLIWNGSMQFASFKHTAEIAHWHETRLHVDHVLEFIGVQMLLMGPVLSLIMLYASVKRQFWREMDDKLRLILSFTAPILILYTVQALVARANYNWAAAAYVGASLLAANTLFGLPQKRWLQLALLSNLILGSLVYHYGWILETSGRPLGKKTDIYISMRGWRALAEQVQILRNRFPEAGLISDNRRILAELNYYLHPNPAHAVIWNPEGKITDHYRLTRDLSQSNQQAFVFVAEEASQAILAGSFRTVMDLGIIRVPVHQDYTLQQQVYYVEGFLGYPKR